MIFAQHKKTMKEKWLMKENKSWKEILSSIQSSEIFLLKNSDSDFIMGWDKVDEISFSHQNFDFNSLQNFIHNNRSNYIFGYLSYDIKNHIIPNIKSKNIDFHEFPISVFWTAKNVILSKNNLLEFYGEKEDFEFFQSQINKNNLIENKELQKINFTARTDKQSYLNSVEKIKSHIQQGDIYEMNYCIDFYSENINLNTLETYFQLDELTQAPFSTYFKWQEVNIMSGSPERFMAKKGNKIISQPIKGTSPRSDDKKIDKELIEELKNNPKEIAENVMIVDLVRNDLSKIATKNSVKVSELFGIYTFKTVHQMISTIEADLKENASETAIIKALFPMGSMTGAPKKMASELIDEIENFKRGIYSGSVGYFEPNGNFDFNVIIRTILYNSIKKTISFSVGSAITILSEAEKEYQECLTKANAMMKCFRD